MKAYKHLISKTFLLLVIICLFNFWAGESSSNEEEEPAQKKKRDQLLYIQSEEFQKILNAKSRHTAVLQAVRTVSLYYMHLLRLVSPGLFRIAAIAQEIADLNSST